MTRIFVITVAALALAACANPINQKTAVNYANAAENARMSGDWVKARMYYGRAAVNAQMGRMPPRTIAIMWYEYGLASGVICDWAEAEAGLTKAYDLDKINDGPALLSLVQLARMNFDAQRYVEAVVYFDRALPELEEQSIGTQDPIGYADFLDEYATALDKVGRPADAKKHRRQSTRIRAAFPNQKAFAEDIPYGTRCETSEGNSRPNAV